MDYATIRYRYLNNYITDAQLQRYVDLGIITQEQYDILYTEKHPIGPLDPEEEN